MYKETSAAFSRKTKSLDETTKVQLREEMNSIWDVQRSAAIMEKMQTTSYKQQMAK